MKQEKKYKIKGLNIYCYDMKKKLNIVIKLLFPLIQIIYLK